MVSPRALYEEGVVQPLDFTILPPSQRAWWAQLDNKGILRSSFGHITFPEGDKKIIKMATEEFDLGYGGKEMVWSEF